MLVDVFENLIETCCREEKCYPFDFVSLPRFVWDAGLKHTEVEKRISKTFFLFFQNGIRDATSGAMGKGDEDSVGDNKIVEDKQMYNPEGNQQEQFISKDGWEVRFEKYIQVSKMTSSETFFYRKQVSLEPKWRT